MSATERIQALLQPLAWVQSAWLYGSRARGQARLDSDWDIAILLAGSFGKTTERTETTESSKSALGGEFQSELVQKLQEDLEEALQGEVSLAVLNQADTLLCREAIDGQVLLRRNPSAQAEFVSRICRIAEDDRIRLERGLVWWREAQA